MSLRNTIGSADLEAKDFAFAQNTIAGLCADAEYFTHLLNAHHIGIVFYENIKAGTEGVIVHEYDGRAFEVEFFDDEDNTIDVVTTPTKYLVFVVSYEDNDK